MCVVWTRHQFKWREERSERDFTLTRITDFDEQAASNSSAVNKRFGSGKDNKGLGERMRFRQQLYIVLWKDVFLAKVKRHYVSSILDLVIIAVIFAHTAKYAIRPQRYQIQPETKHLAGEADGYWRKGYSERLRIYTTSKNDSWGREFLENARKALHIQLPLATFNSREDIINQLHLLNGTHEKGLGIIIDESVNKNINATRLSRILFIGNNEPFDIFVTFSDRILLPKQGNPEHKPEVYLALPIATVILERYMRRLAAAINATAWNYSIAFRQFPYQKVAADRHPDHNFARLVYFTAATQVLPFLYVITTMSTERVTGMRELLQLSGLERNVYWLGKVVSIYFINIVRITVQLVVLTGVPNEEGFSVISGSDPMLLFMVLSVAYICLMVHAMVLSTLFDNESSAVAAGMCYFIISLVLPYTILETADGTGYYMLDRNVKLLSAIIPMMNFHWTWRIYERYEKFRGGLHFGDFFGGAGSPDENSLFQYVGINLISLGISSILMWYLDNVMPTGPGIKKRLGFFLEKNYWSPNNVQVVHPDILMSEEQKNNFEEEVFRTERVLSILDVSKKFGALIALDRVSMQLYENQITVLLGQNGAGKTTLLGIATGFLEPTNGQVILNGYDLAEAPDEARKSLGYCPQENILFDDMTVEEHLLFFAVLREENRDKIKREIVTVIIEMALKEYRFDLIGNLSLSSQRRVSAALALLMYPKVIVMDEPSQFMDPDGRKQLWEVLLKARRYSSVFITTQNMDEADVLGDRVFILVEGNIVCCGSTDFLKRKFGAGYALRFKKTENMDVVGIENVLRLHAPNTHVGDDSPNQITFILGQVLSRQLVTLFRTLEKYQSKLGFSTLRVMVTTLNDVFVKVGTRGDDKELNTVGQNVDLKLKEKLVDQLFDIPTQPNSSSRVFAALIRKRIADFQVNLSVFVQAYVLPILLYAMMTNLEDIAMTTSRQTMIYVKRPPENQFAVDGAPMMFGQRNEIVYIFKRNWTISSLESNLANALTEQGVILKYESGVSDVNEFYVSRVRNNLQEFLLKDYIAYELVNNSEIIINFNNNDPFTPLAGITILVHAMHKMLGFSEAGMFRVIIEAPDLEKNLDFKSSAYSGGELASMQLRAIFFPLISTFMSYHYSMFPIAERRAKVKLLQTMAGVSGWMYWLSNFAFDYVIYSFGAIFFSIAMYFARDTLFSYALVVLNLSHGFAAIPFVYLFSFVMYQTGVGASSVAFLLLIGGSVGVILQGYMGTNFFASSGLLYLFNLIPSFAFHEGAQQILKLTQDNKFCLSDKIEFLKSTCFSSISREDGTSSLRDCCDALKEGRDRAEAIHSPLAFGYPDTGFVTIVLLIAQGVVNLAILAFVESHFMYCLIQKLYADTPTSVTSDAAHADFGAGTKGNLQKAVSAEAAMADEAAANYTKDITTFGKGITVQKMTKVYHSGDSPVRAIDNVTFNVLFGNCLGYLGVNGAGKSSTFRCLTGDVYPAFGNAFIKTFSLMDEFHDFRGNLGYIPQKDGLLESLTGLQHLELYCVLRSIHEDHTPRLLRLLSTIFKLEDFVHLQVSSYSNGNRRRLSMAIAFLGMPHMVLMDEPYVGMDNISHYHIFRFIKMIQSRRRMNMIFSTHFLTDVEELCMRMAVLSSGRLICIGVVEELKQEFGKGYTITVKTYPNKKQDTLHHSDIINAIKTTFDGAELQHNFEGVLEFRMPHTLLRWSQVFQNVNKIRKKIKVQDLFVTDTTMEQIFNSITRKSEAECKAHSPQGVPARGLIQLPGMFGGGQRPAA